MRSIQQGEGVGPKDISELWPLLQLRYAPFNRLPTKDEWIAVDNLSVVLFSKKHADLRKKFVSSQVPMLITWLPLLMLIVAGVTLCLGVYSAADTQSSTLGSIIQKVIQFLHNLFSGAQAASAGTQAASSTGDYDWCVASYLFWSVSMGVIGAAASVGMNAISVLNDTTFDISNRHQIWLRVILGGVFALVLALPFGLENFALFCYYAGHLLSNDATPTTVLLPNATATVLPPNAASTTASIAYVASRTSSLTYAFALLVPFLLGFSTSLVTNVLSTLINWAQKCFDGVNKGLSGKGTQSGQAGTAQAPQSGTASATT